MIRLHVAQDLEAGTTVEPAPEQARYLTTVMRRNVGDDLLLFNGRDGEWRATIASVGKRGSTLALQERTREQSAGPDVHLLIAVVKRDRLETIVEKATELGVRAIELMVTRYTQSDRTRPDRLQAIATEAAEQTGRLDVPAISGPTPLEQRLAAWDHPRSLIFCDETGLGWPLQHEPPGPPVALLVGPEGGFAPEERERLRRLPFVKPVSLGPRILRADTAAIAALALWQASRGDWT